MILAAAQIQSFRENISRNLEEHYRFIELAAQHKVDFITFPEMSLTGYERKLAVKQAFTPNDARLDQLKELALKYQMIIVAGAPIKIGSSLYIGSFIIKPDYSVLIYTKQFLHEGEEVYFESSFDYNPIIELKGEKISLAICADIENPLHPQNAANNKVSVYCPGIFYTPGGMEGVHEKLSGYAKKYNMNILMANFTGRSWDLDAGGKSAFWNQQGELISKLNNVDSALLVIEKQNNNWTGKTVQA